VQYWKTRGAAALPSIQRTLVVMNRFAVDWVAALQTKTPLTASTSCLQFNADFQPNRSSSHHISNFFGDLLDYQPRIPDSFV
jgi:hypothetical protein